MIKQTVCAVKILLILFTSVRSEEILRIASNSANIHHGIMDGFHAQVPEPFEQIGNKYYHIAPTEANNWFGAIENCLRIGGYLLNPQNTTELRLIQKMLKNSEVYWTDLNNLVKESEFKSVTTGGIGNFLNSPDNKEKPINNMCGVLQFDKTTKMFTVQTKNCFTDKARTICETKLPTTVSFVFVK